MSPPPPAAPPADPNQPRATAFTTLRLLREKQVLTEEEYQAALRDLGEPLGQRASDANTFVFGKWSTTIYGFAEADFMYHSTEGFNDFVGNQQVPRPGTFAGDHGRTTFTARDSRFGLRVKTPSPAGYSFTANLEADFLGSEPGIFQNTGGTAPTPGSTNSEAAFFSNPTLRIRHAFFKAETPILDFTVGQTWNLIGWQGTYIPAVVQWPGVVGELFGRTVQARVGKTIKTDPLTVELAVAALRPSQRDSSIPNIQAGARAALTKWTGIHTSFLTATAVQPLSLAITGDTRTFKVPEFTADPHAVNKASGGAFAVDAFIPIIPGTKDKKDNALALTAEFARGSGIADQYTAAANGIANPALPPPTATPQNPNPASPAFPARIDPGLAVYDASGALHLVKTQSWYVNGEYYVPGTEGRLGLFAGYYRLDVKNLGDFTTNPAAARKSIAMIEGGAFVDATQAIRIGLDYAQIRDTYQDGTLAKDWAVQSSAFFFF
ncbi:hypothetical protein [Hyalangium versicolor]|uniref:hypothetical protein n=1 Tax=Hyalangium versicolor TaxID=2861190 RepID=UPI001CCFDDEB|nr:hypothetical protein [Hyalangium versicolor]